VDTPGGGAGDRAGHDEHGKRDEDDPERLHELTIGRTTHERDWPNGQFGAALGAAQAAKVGRRLAVRRWLPVHPMPRLLL
jgi:hypothetical protein